MNRRPVRSLQVALFTILLMSVVITPAAAAPAPDLYFPMLSNFPAGGTPGENKIRNAGTLPVTAIYDEAQGEPQDFADTTPEYPIESITCTITNWGASEVRNLADTVALDADAGIIYPGALIQGGSFATGGFTPITIPRSGGTIYMTGVKLAPNAEYSREVDEITGSKVKNALEDILSADVQGTAANANFEVQETYSYDHMLFTLGVDARYGLGSMSADLAIENTTDSNFVFVKFVQKYYDVIYEDPQSPASVFRDGAEFQDPEDQIGQGNPPLYVHKVSYGRVVFFVLESQYSANSMTAALQGAYGQQGRASIDVETGLTYDQIMSNTSVTYFVRGGDAGLALALIDNPTDGMYEALKQFLADPEAANYSPSSPGAPIAYTLRYLSNRAVAAMSYSVAYDRKECNTNLVRDAKIEFALEDIYREVQVWVNGTRRLTHNRDQSGANTGKIDLSPWLTPNANNKVELKLFVPCVTIASLAVTIYKDGAVAVGKRAESLFTLTDRCSGSTPFWVWTYTINKTTGAITRVN